ncbi:UDP-glucose 4-epimerase GalE [Asanoa iriomotensis]|uniref:UDP-glucose 4-epimerase n=1 Tax=Asanoa iriomotensis TaxID=234613 RepID=A0ABQ4CHN8_9ACTN|nr:UDP-glucose 4-epimerase GalE [Asanoa iriomotensis]GIF61825.1 UDP-glucose 4-epimerase GalE [Asanoa iriomotensis]
MKVLIAGGAGYIGSTIASMCLDNGITPIILDNLSTGCIDFVHDRIFYRGDIDDGTLVKKIFDDHPDVSIALHCAAVLVAPESVRHPLRYYRENVAKTLAFVDALTQAGCRRLIFSSSAAIYAPTPTFGVDESSPVAPATPYGWSKAMLEQILHDCCLSGDLRVVSLRYQNVVGADPYLRTGPTIAGTERALDSLLDAALADRPFTIAGTDWPTRDGTPVRDYVHVWDLARAHLLALQAFDTVASTAPDCYLALDLGTGVGTTVGELIRAVEAVVGRRITITHAPRRPGDIAGCYTRSRLALQHLGWQPRLPLNAAVRDLLSWNKANHHSHESPQGMHRHDAVT